MGAIAKVKNIMMLQKGKPDGSPTYILWTYYQPWSLYQVIDTDARTEILKELGRTCYPAGEEGGRRKVSTSSNYISPRYLNHIFRRDKPHLPPHTPHH